MRIKNCAPKINYSTYYSADIVNTQHNPEILSSTIQYPSGLKATYPINYSISGYTTVYPSSIPLVETYNIDKSILGFILCFHSVDRYISTTISDSYLSMSGTINSTHPIGNMNPINDYTKLLFNLGSGNDIRTALSGNYPGSDGYVGGVNNTTWAGEYYFGYARDSFYDEITKEESSTGIPCWVFERPERNDISGRVIVEQGYFQGEQFYHTTFNKIYDLQYKILQVDIYHSGEVLWRCLYTSGFDPINGNYHRLPRSESPTQPALQMGNNIYNGGLVYQPGKTNRFSKLTGISYGGSEGVILPYVQFAIYNYYDILPTKASFDIVIESKVLDEDNHGGDVYVNNPGTWQIVGGVPSPFSYYTQDTITTTINLTPRSDTQPFAIIDGKETYLTRNIFYGLGTPSFIFNPPFNNDIIYRGSDTINFEYNTYTAQTVGTGTPIPISFVPTTHTSVHPISVATTLTLGIDDMGWDVEASMVIGYNGFNVPILSVESTYCWKSAEYSTSFDILSSGYKTNQIMGSPLTYTGWTNENSIHISEYGGGVPGGLFGNSLFSELLSFKMTSMS